MYMSTDLFLPSYYLMSQTIHASITVATATSRQVNDDFGQDFYLFTPELLTTVIQQLYCLHLPIHFLWLRSRIIMIIKSHKQVLQNAAVKLKKKKKRALQFPGVTGGSNSQPYMRSRHRWLTVALLTWVSEWKVETSDRCIVVFPVELQSQPASTMCFKVWSGKPWTGLACSSPEIQLKPQQFLCLSCYVHPLYFFGT